MKMLPNFILYTRDNCQWCDKAKELLATVALPICEFDVSDDTNKEILKSRGLKTVPQIWFNEPNVSDAEYIGGFDRLEVWLKNNGDRLDGRHFVR